MTVNLAMVHFPQQATAYQAMSQLATAPFASQVQGAAILERDAQGKLTVPEADSDNPVGSGFATGSLIGMLVGMLGGPLGMLLGWGVGAAAGSATDVDHADTQASALLSLSDLLPNNSNVLVVQIDETDPAALDQFAAALGGHVDRRPLAQVLAELEAADEAAREAKKAADKKLREEKWEGKKKDLNDWVEDIKSKFSRDDKDDTASQA